MYLTVCTRFLKVNFVLYMHLDIGSNIIHDIKTVTSRYNITLVSKYCYKTKLTFKNLVHTCWCQRKEDIVKV